MKTIITNKCKDILIHSYNGIKLSIKGYCFLIDNSYLLNAIDETTGEIISDKLKSDDELSEILLSDLIKNDTIVYNPNKNNKFDILNKLFDTTYIPNLELKNQNGDSFGCYDISVDKGLNTHNEFGFLSTDYTSSNKGFDAILIIGEKYTETKSFVKGLNRSFLAAIIIPEKESEYFYIDKNTINSRKITFQFGLAEKFKSNDINTSALKLDDTFFNLNDKSEMKDLSTYQIKSNLFLMPGTTSSKAFNTNKEYKEAIYTILSGTEFAGDKIAPMSSIRDNNYTLADDEIDLEKFIDDNILFTNSHINLIDNNEKINNIWNITPAVNIFDAKLDKITRPQLSLSWSNTSCPCSCDNCSLDGKIFNSDSISFIYSPELSSITLNQDGAKYNQQIDIFPEDSDIENSYCNEFKYKAFNYTNTEWSAVNDKTINIKWSAISSCKNFFKLNSNNSNYNNSNKLFEISSKYNSSITGYDNTFLNSNYNTINKINSAFLLNSNNINNNYPTNFNLSWLDSAISGISIIDSDNINIINAVPKYIEGTSKFYGTMINNISFIGSQNVNFDFRHNFSFDYIYNNPNTSGYFGDYTFGYANNINYIGLNNKSCIINQAKYEVDFIKKTPYCKEISGKYTLNVNGNNQIRPITLTRGVDYYYTHIIDDKNVKISNPTLTTDFTKSNVGYNVNNISLIGFNGLAAAKPSDLQIYIPTGINKYYSEKYGQDYDYINQADQTRILNDNYTIIFGSYNAIPGETPNFTRSTLQQYLMTKYGLSSINNDVSSLYAPYSAIDKPVIYKADDSNGGWINSIDDLYFEHSQDSWWSNNKAYFFSKYSYDGISWIGPNYSSNSANWNVYDDETTKWNESYNNTSSLNYDRGDYSKSIIVAVGDGYNTDPNMDNVYFTPAQNVSKRFGYCSTTKRMNLFSIEKDSYQLVHNNNYDENPHYSATCVKGLNSIFAVRGWIKPTQKYFNHYYKNNSGILNHKLFKTVNYYHLQNCIYTPSGIYFPKTRSSNDEYKITMQNINDMLSDNYIKGTTNRIITTKLDNKFTDFLNKRSTYIYKTAGIIKGANKGTRYKYYVSDILTNLAKTKGVNIPMNGIKGLKSRVYTIYLMNTNKTNNIYFKGIRLRRVGNSYQTLQRLKTIKPGQVQRIMYMNNGYNGEYGVMNFDYYNEITDKYIK